MKMIYILVLIAVAAFIAVTFFRLYSSTSWETTKAHITHIDIVQERQTDSSSQTAAKVSYDYRVDLKYTFVFDGKEYQGSKFYPGLPNIFEYKEDAVTALKGLQVGDATTAYFNPLKPTESSLYTLKGLPNKTLILSSLIILFVFGVVATGFYFFTKYIEF
ncbi:DUF3592 domain-containing protein [Teredinibacter waterburyi]|uniref:DUF3592 domain-containing protein n=1 Tax=Teredinibacter waterburyi TaxID=1500538 RepID=UPI00165EDEA5|nr:DUF3592 domain-containing protein [Teredinibacter waterburyi]